MNTDSIIQDMRSSIGRFCYEECNAYCCRKGTLPINVRELKLLSRDKTASLLFYKNRMSVVLPCPSLDGSKCSIHENDGRPKVCKEFPIFVKGKKVVIVEMCLAVRNNLLYPYIRQLKHIGCNVVMK